MTKVGVISLGCPKNLVDTEVMLGALSRAGYEPTSNAADAEVILVNTCSFIEPAQKESIDTILEMAEHKRSGSARKLIVAGCLVERYRDKILREIPEIDALIGTNEIESIVAAVHGELDDSNGNAPDPYLYHDATPRIRSTPGHYAYLKIAEGCDHPCSFCIIPQLRGKFRSRRFESVVREAEMLFRTGAREIILIGQDTTSYGEDLELRDGLPSLLGRLAELPEAGWIRFLYAYPNRITQQLLDTIARHPQLAGYIDCPLQHASRNVLAQMNRGGSAESFLRFIDNARRTIPGVALRTSMIVGFPGETEADFDILCDFVREAKLDHLGVFLYSDEDTAGSHAHDGKVPGEVAEQRRARLLELQQEIVTTSNAARIGQTHTALLEGPSEESDLLWQARLQAQAPEIDSVTYINDSALDEMPPAGSFVTVEITEARGYDLVGRITAVEERATGTTSSSEPIPAQPALIQIQPG